MDERLGERGRQSRRLRALPTPVDVELQVRDAPPLLEIIDELPEPRIADLDALLREVDGLRSTLRRDLSLAATAVEAGADDLAGWLLLGDDGQVRSFEERALAHLHRLEAQEAASVPAVARRRRRRMLPAAPFVAACAALLGVLSGSVPGVTGSHQSSPSTSTVALDSYARFTDLATSGASDLSISEAAEQFHADLAPLVAAAGTDPAAAEKALALLNSERAVIASGVDSPALQAVLRQADLLVARLQASLPHRPRPQVVVPAPPPQQQQQQPNRKASPAATSRPAAKSPSPAPSPTPSPRPTPAASPQPTPEPTASNPLPGSPLHG